MKVRTRKLLAGIATAVLSAGLVFNLNVKTADAARQHSFLHSSSSERSAVLVFYKWNCTDGRSSDFVYRGSHAQIDVGCIWLPKDYSLWLDTRPGSGVNWTRWATRSKTKSRGISMASMPVTKSQWALRRGNEWGKG